MTMQEEPAQYLAWDSDFFGVRIARAADTRLTAQSVMPLLAWCDSEAIDCLYFMAESDDAQTIRTLEQHRFQLTDIRVMMQGQLQPVDSEPATQHVRSATDADIPALRLIARKSHHHTRFYADEHFPDERCDALYETWIENSVRGYADHVFVATDGEQPVGYLTCHLRQSVGNLGLVAVSDTVQGKGHGRQLVQAAQAWFVRNGATTLTVVTNGSNVAAQRFYQKCGFTSASVHIWYHRWAAKTVSHKAEPVG
jgi:dTDP-4-amino-4,6-dideoxy-D-galactose acyltransferase